MGRVVKCSMGKGMGMGMSMVMGQVVGKSMFMGEVMGVVDKVVRVMCEGMERVGKSVGQVRCCVRCRHSIGTTDQQVEFGLPRESGLSGPKGEASGLKGESKARSVSSELRPSGSGSGLAKASAEAEGLASLLPAPSFRRKKTKTSTSSLRPISRTTYK